MDPAPDESLEKGYKIFAESMEKHEFENLRLCEKVYKENLGKKLSEQKAALREAMNGVFMFASDLDNYVEDFFFRKDKNRATRTARLYRKAYMMRPNYFATFTYDGEKLTEKEFEKKLKKCLNNFSTRKDWLYILAPEYSPVKKRFHYHGLFKIPDGTMPGELEEVKDYSTKKHRMQTSNQNSFFKDRFGRNDFMPLSGKPDELAECLVYLVKYLEKDGNRIIYSRGIPDYSEADVPEEYIFMALGWDGRKFLLYDDIMDNI